LKKIKLMLAPCLWLTTLIGHGATHVHPSFTGGMPHTQAMPEAFEIPTVITVRGDSGVGNLDLAGLPEILRNIRDNERQELMHLRKRMSNRSPGESALIASAVARFREMVDKNAATLNKIQRQLDQALHSASDSDRRRITVLIHSTAEVVRGNQANRSEATLMLNLLKNSVSIG